VHAAVFPNKERWDEAIIADWESTLLRGREAVFKKLEEARASRLIGSGLEAAVFITAPAPLRERLGRYEASGPPFPGNLANLFIVSRVEVAEGPELSVRVSRAPGAKCERCWTYSENVGRLRHPGVCERCDQVLATLEAR
jgi:isoleucyl-tRNA synthetase